MKNAVIFPGQGAQVVGMGKDLCEAYPECRAVFEAANEVLGFDLARICFEGPIEELTRSSHAQPGIFVTSMAAYAALKQRVPDLAFQAAAGLSSGEWTALHLAGAISFEDTLNVLRARGEFMQAACDATPGGMVSIIGLDADAAAAVAEKAGIYVANFNSPAQTVLSGSIEGVEAAEALAVEAGAKRAIRLTVAGAFHSPLVALAGEKLADFLTGITLSDPQMTVVTNVTGAPHEGAESIRSLMARQVTESVQWVKGVEWLRDAGVGTYVECGPGKVLTGLVKRIDNTATLHNIQAQSDLERVSESIKQG